MEDAPALQRTLAQSRYQAQELFSLISSEEKQALAKWSEDKAVFEKQIKSLEQVRDARGYRRLGIGVTGDTAVFGKLGLRTLIHEASRRLQRFVCALVPILGHGSRSKYAPCS
jgi:hypothetical protein